MAQVVRYNNFAPECLSVMTAAPLDATATFEVEDYIKTMNGSYQNFHYCHITNLPLSKPWQHHLGYTSQNLIERNTPTARRLIKLSLFLNS